MFKEYALWRGKLETIETRMKEEADHWKQAAEKLQKETHVSFIMRNRVFTK